MNRIKDEILHFPVLEHIETSKIIHFPVSMRFAGKKYLLNDWNSLFERCFIVPTQYDVVDSLYLSYSSLVDYSNNTIVENYKDVYYNILVGTPDKIFLYKEIFNDFKKEFDMQNEYYDLPKFIRDRLDSKHKNISMSTSTRIKTLNRIRNDNCLVFYKYQVVHLYDKE